MKNWEQYRLYLVLATAIFAKNANLLGDFFWWNL